MDTSQAILSALGSTPVALLFANSVDNFRRKRRRHRLLSARDLLDLQVKLRRPKAPVGSTPDKSLQPLSTVRSLRVLSENR